MTVTIQQKQNPTFTINSTSPVIAEDRAVTIAGILYGPAAATTVNGIPATTTAAPTTTATTPEPNTLVTLYGRVPGGAWEQIATATTVSDGGYTFTESPVNNTVYQVRTTLAKPRFVRSTALLYQGVQDAVTLSGSDYLTATVGETVTLNGTVSPSQSNQIAYLQSLGSDGNWHNVETGVVNGTSFSFQYTFGQAATVELRAWVTGNSLNLGAASAPVTVAVSGVAPVTSLPTAS